MEHIGGVDILEWCHVLIPDNVTIPGQTNLKAAKGLIHKAL